MPYDRYPFELPPLPYAYDALEPAIDRETMYYHHDKHFKAYIDNLNKALEPYPNLQELTLEQLLTRTRFLPREVYTQIMHNGGGVYNHALYFQCLSPYGEQRSMPERALLRKIEDTFGSYDDFVTQFSREALKVFGSGWTYLVTTRQGGLKIVNFKNQETPLAMKATPVILVDVWEHAYYLQYKNARGEYLESIWSVIRYPQM